MATAARGTDITGVEIAELVAGKKAGPVLITNEDKYMDSTFGKCKENIEGHIFYDFVGDIALLGYKMQSMIEDARKGKWGYVNTAHRDLMTDFAEMKTNFDVFGGYDHEPYLTIIPLIEKDVEETVQILREMFKKNRLEARQ